MPNRIARARHLTLVPDIPTASDVLLDDRAGTASQIGGLPHAIVQLVLDIEVQGYADGRVWRRVRVRSDLLLPELHGILTTVMGWPTSADYTFSRTDDGRVFSYRPRGEHERAGSVESLPAAHLRIDALLAAPGDQVSYDYGTEWTSVVELVTVDTDVDDLRPRCLDGVGAVPAGSDDTADSASPADAANVRLKSSPPSRSTEVESSAASPAIARLFTNARSTPLPRLLDLLPRCELTIESSVDLAVAQTAMSKLAWFLGRIGPHGIPMTEAGCLPGAAVDAIRDELDWGIGWHGAGSDEIDHHQARDLREAVRDLGLARVWRGVLVRTKLGSRIANDHIALWNHCAARLPLGRREYEQDAGTLFLVALAASAAADQRDAMLVETMHGLRWGIDTLDAFEVQKAAHPTVAFLDLIGAHGPLYYLSPAGGDSPSWSRRFARDALRT